jgi:CBS domain-containing protein
MGDLNVKAVQDQKDLQSFTRNLLKDVHALEKMLKDGWFETGTIRIGAEQEMCLIDGSRKPACLNLEALEAINNPEFTTELARFNLEANLEPLLFEGDAISRMHRSLKATLEDAIEKVHGLDSEIILTGILPTIRKSDVDISRITPLDRYHSLMEGLQRMRGGDMFELRLSGLDEINIKQKTAMLEACNTSFQVHLQVNPDDFVDKYNVAQALAGPVMAIAVNSPSLFGRRLWHETRIALFQQSLDIRVFNEHMRERSPRVTFGTQWLQDSIVEIYHEDIARFKVILSTDIDEDVFQKIRDGKTPKLRALNIHNSTVYRWNRPCYGISDNGKPHLRIENRIFPAGPSLPDAFANAAFWLGLMTGFQDEVKDVRKVMHFDDAKSNFFAAARFGLDTKFRWLNGERIPSTNLILERLLPIAKNGLKKVNIKGEDIDYYLGIIEERAKTGRTGSRWFLDSWANLNAAGTPRDEISSSITASIVKNQYVGKPVHEWELASLDDVDYEPSNLLVEEFMTTDLITVNQDDILDLVANLMDWRRIRHILVEDEKGHLVGLVTARIVMRYFAKRYLEATDQPLAPVSEIMVKEPITISPYDSILKAMDVMRENRVSCLPVVAENELVGLITESDFMAITGNLVKRLARKKNNNKPSTSQENEK